VISRPQARGRDGEDSAAKTAADSGEAEAPLQRDEPDDDAAERSTALDPPDAKRAKLTGAARRRAKKEARAADVAAEKAEADVGGTGEAPAAGSSERSGQRGQNKNRKFGKLSDQGEVGLCDSVVKGGSEGAKSCRFGDKCKFEHDIQRYMLCKKRDLLFPSPPIFVEGDYKNVVRGKDGVEWRKMKMEELGLLRPIATSSTDGLTREAEEYLDAQYSTTAPFVKWTAHPEQPTEEGEEASKDVKQSLLHTSPKTHCSAYHQLGGQCPAGWRCRFLGAHVRVQEASDTSVQGGAADSAFHIGDVQVQGAGHFEFSTANQEKEDGDTTYRLGEYNWLSGDGMRALRKRRVSEGS
jgi:tRNA-dihydrouridine synthase 3